MATVLDTLRGAVYETSTALIDSKITGKLADLVADTVKSGMGVVDSALEIVQELTQPDDEAPEAAPAPPSRGPRARSGTRKERRS